MTQSSKRQAATKLRRPTIRQRAGAIIADVQGYDAETRAAVFNALEDHELAELVRRAEAGETILDTTGERPAEDHDLRDFAHYLSNALRIARYNPLIPASLYNGLADALNDFENDLPSLARVSESEPHILLTLEAYATPTAAQTAKGGERD